MAEDRFDIKQGDTRPYLGVTIKAGGVAVDLTDTTVVFSMKDADGTIKVNRQTVNVTDEDAGECEYRWVAADTDTIGLFEGEFEVTFSDGKVLTAPNDTNLYIEVHEDIA